jgi:hypothetical protein
MSPLLPSAFVAWSGTALALAKVLYDGLKFTAFLHWQYMNPV